MNASGCRWHARSIDRRGPEKPNRIKISFTVNRKDYTGQVAPDQASFGPEYFLAYTLPDFEAKILSRIPTDCHDDGETLFQLMEQCFQDVALTEWTNIVTKRCPNNADQTKENFVECQCNYLEAIAGFPNLGDQIIRWFRTCRKPALLSLQEFNRGQVQLFSYLKKGLLCRMMELPMP